MILLDRLRDSIVGNQWLGKPYLTIESGYNWLDDSIENINETIYSIIPPARISQILQYKIRSVIERVGDYVQLFPASYLFSLQSLYGINRAYYSTTYNSAGALEGKALDYAGAIPYTNRSKTFYSRLHSQVTSDMIKEAVNGLGLNAMPALKTQAAPNFVPSMVAQPFNPVAGGIPQVFSNMGTVNLLWDFMNLIIEMINPGILMPWNSWVGVSAVMKMFGLRGDIVARYISAAMFRATPALLPGVDKVITGTGGSATVKALSTVVQGKTVLFNGAVWAGVMPYLGWIILAVFLIGVLIKIRENKETALGGDFWVYKRGNPPDVNKYFIGLEAPDGERMEEMILEILIELMKEMPGADFGLAFDVDEEPALILDGSYQQLNIDQAPIILAELRASMGLQKINGIWTRV